MDVSVAADDALLTAELHPNMGDVEDTLQEMYLFKVKYTIKMYSINSIILIIRLKCMMKIIILTNRGCLAGLVCRV